MSASKLPRPEAEVSHGSSSQSRLPGWNECSGDPLESRQPPRSTTSGDAWQLPSSRSDAVASMANAGDLPRCVTSAPTDRCSSLALALKPSVLARCSGPAVGSARCCCSSGRQPASGWSGVMRPDLDGEARSSVLSGRRASPVSGGWTVWLGPRCELPNCSGGSARCGARSNAGMPMWDERTERQDMSIGRCCDRGVSRHAL